MKSSVFCSMLIKIFLYVLCEIFMDGIAGCVINIVVILLRAETR